MEVHPLPADQLPHSVGPYRLDERLGGGGMGEVYRGYDARLDRPVALKRVRPGVGDPDMALKRFRREARTVARLRHPAIVQVYDWVESTDGAWLVMELVEGRPLRDLLYAGSLEPARVVSFARDLLEGLAAAHESGLVHRDLKAGNVMVTLESSAGRGPGEHARILDFGLAKKVRVDQESRLSMEGKIVGTLSALAPEQVLGKAVDARTDLFALGCLLYEALTGSHPFLAPNAGQTLHRICNVQQIPARTSRAEISESLSTFVDSLLEKDPRRRPSSAAVALEMLERVSGFRGVFETLDTETLSGDGLGTRTEDESASDETHGTERSMAGGGRLGPAWAMALGIGVLIVLLLGMLGFLGSRGWGGPPADPVFVAVPMPTLTTAGDREVELGAQALHMALLQGLVDLQGVIALEVPEGAPESTQELAHELAADEVIASALDCHDGSCRASLRRIDAEGRVLWAQAFSANPALLLDLSEAVVSYLGTAFPEAKRRPGALDFEVQPADYERFLRLQRRFQRRDQGFSRDQLLEELERLAETSPRFAAIPLLTAHIALQRFQVSRDEQDVELASSSLARALDLAPQDSRVLLLAARVARQRGDLDAAEAWLERVRHLEPGQPEANLQLALLFEQRGDVELAISLAREAAQQQPLPYVLFNSADLLYRQGEVDGARELIERGLERSSLRRFDGLSRLAQLELAHGDLERAAELYGSLVERAPEETELTNLGTALMMLGRLEEARSCFAQVVEQNPSSPYATLNLADVTKLQAESAEAASLYERVLELTAADPRADQLASVRAQALAQLGRKEAAVEAIQAALRRRPDHPWVAFEAALVYALIEDRASALWNARRALDAGIEPRWFRLAWFEPVREDLDLAIQATADPVDGS